MKVNTKIYKSYNFIISFILLITTYVFLYKQLFYHKDLYHTSAYISSLFSSASLVYGLVTVFLLMLANWSIEAIKWRYLINKIEHISFWKSIKAIFAGTSISVFTPNRIGEYVGRVFLLKQSNPWEGILVTIVGSLSQLLITIIMGSAGIIFLLHHNYFVFSADSNLLVFIIDTLIIITNILLIVLFMNVRIIKKIADKLLSRWPKTQKYFVVLSNYSVKQLASIIFLSFLRYCVFTIQFYLLLSLFDIQIPIIHAFFLITVVFFLQTIIPSIALSELGIRGSVALLVFSWYLEAHQQLTVNSSLGIVSAAALLWLINIILPAIIGSVFLFHLRFFRKT